MNRAWLPIVLMASLLTLMPFQASGQEQPTEAEVVSAAADDNTGENEAPEDEARKDESESDEPEDDKPEEGEPEEDESREGGDEPDEEFRPEEEISEDYPVPLPSDI